jgi:mannan endo-1,4-beta-mannosidase
MRAAQRAMSAFLPLVDWATFARRPLTGDEAVRDADTGRPLARMTADATPPAHPPVVSASGEVAAFACGDATQAIAFVVRADVPAPDGRVRRDVPPRRVFVELPGLAPGRYVVTTFDVERGQVEARIEVAHDGGALAVGPVTLASGAALAVGPAR